MGYRTKEEMVKKSAQSKVGRAILALGIVMSAMLLAGCSDPRSTYGGVEQPEGNPQNVRVFPVTTANGRTIQCAMVRDVGLSCDWSQK